jgi:hypothetical protein
VTVGQDVQVDGVGFDKEKRMGSRGAGRAGSLYPDGGQQNRGHSAQDGNDPHLFRSISCLKSRGEPKMGILASRGRTGSTSFHPWRERCISIGERLAHHFHFPEASLCFRLPDRGH